MVGECETVNYLKLIAVDHRPKNLGLAAAAKASLGIISDIREYSMTANDIDTLNYLVVELTHSGHQALLSNLIDGAPDCRICHALAQQMHTSTEGVNRG